MAKFEIELPTELMHEFQKLANETDTVFGEMTRAGAEVIAKNMRSNAPNLLVSKVHVSKVYKTPSDMGINCRACIYGYIPFSDPNRKYFSRTNGHSAKVYRTTEGVPAEFLANMYEYGRSTAPFPTHPFLRQSINASEINEAMEKAQKKATGGLFK